MQAKYETIEDVVIRLKMLIKKIEQTHGFLDDLEISRGQFRVIFPIVRDCKGYTMNELGEKMGIDKALVSRTIADLESKGFVERDKEAGSNERNYNILLSRKGKEFFEKQMAKMKELNGDLLNNVTRDEFVTFVSVLNRLTERSS